MSASLVIFGGDGPGSALAWALVDSRGDISEEGVCEIGARLPGASHAVLVLSGVEAQLKRITLPARTEAQARAAAAFQFEGTLADEADTHYAIGASQTAEGDRLVAAISASRLRAWLDHCRASGADPAAVVLDCAIWPVAENEIAIVETPARVIVAGGGAGGFSIEPALAASVLVRWFADVRASANRIVLCGGDLAAWSAALGQIGANLELAPPADVPKTLAAAAAEPPAFSPNLRQGEFANAARSRQPLKVWRLAAVLAAAAVLLQVGALVVDGIRDRQAADRIRTSAQRDFLAMAPKDTRIVNLGAQATALLNRFEQSARHPLLSAAVPLVAALRQQPLARIDEVRHQMPGRMVRVQVSAPDRAALESVASAMRAQGVKVDVRDLPPREGRYASELNVEAPV